MALSTAYQHMAQYKQWLTCNDDKQPLNPHTGKLALWKKHPDKCLTTYQDAVAACKAHPDIHKGLVFVLTEHDPFTCIDLDKVIDLPDTPNGTPIIDPMAKDIVRKLKSYTELSKSGRGLHIFVEARTDTLVGMPFVDCVEMYSTGRCIVMTNNPVSDVPDSIESRQDLVNKLANELSAKRKAARSMVNRLTKQIGALKTAVEGTRNNTLNVIGYMAGQCLERLDLREYRVKLEILTACDAIGLLEPDEEQKTLATLDHAITDGRANADKPIIQRKKHYDIQAQQQQKTDIYLEGDLAQELDDIVDALVAANEPPTLFTRSGKLVRIRTDEKTNAPLAEELSDGMLDVRMARTMRFLRFNEHAQDYKDAYPPPRHIRDIMQLEHSPFPPLAGIVQMPVLRSDYTVFSTPGHDQISHIYFWPQLGLRRNPLPDLTQENARAAALRVADYIKELPFVTQADYANTFALLLSVVTRSLYDIMPMAVISAAIGGTGKSLIGDIVSLLMCGRRAAAIPYPTDDDEMRKKLTTAVAKGLYGPLYFDNIPDGHMLYSAALEGFLSNLYWSDRLLNTSTSPDFENRTIPIATGNNIGIKGMLTRRTYPIRLDAGMSNPWSRTGPTDADTWTYPHLLYTVLERRADIWIDLLTMVLAWHAGGEKPFQLPSNDTLYFEWLRITSGVLAFSGIDGFYTHDAAVEDMDSEQWSAWLAHWHDHHSPMQTREIVDALKADQQFADLLPDVLQSGFRDDKKRDSTFPTMLGYQLRSKMGTPFGTRQISVMHRDKHKPVTWMTIERKRTTRTVILQTNYKSVGVDRVNRDDNSLLPQTVAIIEINNSNRSVESNENRDQQKCTVENWQKSDRTEKSKPNLATSMSHKELSPHSTLSTQNALEEERKKLLRKQHSSPSNHHKRTSTEPPIGMVKVMPIPKME